MKRRRVTQIRATRVIQPKICKYSNGSGVPSGPLENPEALLIQFIKEKASENCDCTFNKDIFNKDKLFIPKHTHIAGSEDLLEQPVEVLLLSTQVALVL